MTDEPQKKITSVLAGMAALSRPVGGPSEPDLIEMLSTTGNLLAEFKKVSLGSGDEAKNACKVIRGAVDALKKLIRSYDVPDQPPGTPLPTVTLVE